MDNIQIEQLFASGNMVQIEFRDEKNHKRVYKTMVGKATDDLLLLNLPEEHTATIESGTKLAVITSLPNSSDQYLFRAEVIAYHQGHPSNIVINIPTPVRAIFKRKFFRCDVDLLFLYQDQDANEHQGRVINLSASGLLATVPYDKNLKTALDLQCKMLLTTSADSEVEENEEIYEELLSFEAKIIRVEKHKKSDMELALNFENVDEPFQNIITKYLFKRQRELIKSGHIKIRRV